MQEETLGTPMTLLSPLPPGAEPAEHKYSPRAPRFPEHGAAQGAAAKCGENIISQVLFTETDIGFF